MTTPTDQGLLDACKAGDREALETLLERNQKSIYRFAMKMCRDPEDASDVLQETMLAAARTIRDFRGGASLSTWLYTIARSFCIKRHRRSKFAPVALESLDRSDSRDGHHDVTSAAPDPEAQASGREEEHALTEAIARLEPMYREVILLRDGEGLTAPEVAAVVGMSVDAVKSRLHRARATVRAELAALLGEPLPAAASGCPDIVALFSRHLEGDITADVCAEMEAHLQRCVACRAACDSIRRTLSICSASVGPSVPGEVQTQVRRAIQRQLNAAS